ncbi:MAG: Holliday junction resolvase RuvX [Erysipelotrichaceae bacterium]|nr:Holliday junction resolvase RuvX [Erysipelotrichaceae bacterium]MDY5251841.1 Holliday junction resolvase RuvX [Erysipelotrichaceae bacterium]
MRVLGLDLGSVTCGVAISDPLGMIARSVETIRFADEQNDEAIPRIKAICQEQGVEKIVLGLPKHMNGDIGIRANIALAFKEKLESAIGLEVIMIDERMTTMAANRILLAGDVSRKKRKKVIDQMAAVQILQSYLDRN